MMTAMYEDALHDEGEGEWERERVRLSMLELGWLRVWFSACLSFIIMLKALSREFREGLPMELAVCE